MDECLSLAEVAGRLGLSQGDALLLVRRCALPGTVHLVGGGGRLPVDHLARLQDTAAGG